MIVAAESSARMDCSTQWPAVSSALQAEVIGLPKGYEILVAVLTGVAVVADRRTGRCWSAVVGRTGCCFGTTSVEAELCFAAARTAERRIDQSLWADWGTHSNIHSDNQSVEAESTGC